MRCSRATRILQAYLDRELSASQEKRLKHHLDGCSICRLELEAFRKTCEAMDSWRWAEPRRNLVASVMQMLRHEVEMPSKFRQFLDLMVANRRKVLAVGANMAILILLLVAVNVPGLWEKLYKNNKPEPTTIQSNLRMRFPSVERGREKPEEFDPVDVTNSVTDLVNGYNLFPAERVMLFDNLMNDVNNVIAENAGNLRKPSTVRERQVRINYYTMSNGKIIQQQIIFIQRERSRESEKEE